MEILNIIKLIFKLKLEQLAAAELTEPFHSAERSGAGRQSQLPRERSCVESPVSETIFRVN